MVADTVSFNIREARPDDVPALARLHVATFIETHGGVSPPTYELRQSQWQQAFAEIDGSWFCFVVEAPHGELVGFAKGTLHDGGIPGFAGELNKIYLLRRYHRLGLGRGLVGTVARRFLARGISSMLLFGDAGNPSNGFYEALGAEKLFSDTGAFHGGYGWRDLQRLAEVCPVG